MSYGAEKEKIGDDLLSHSLSLHYHRRDSVSLPGSERDRVVPLLYGHQSRGLRKGLGFNGVVEKPERFPGNCTKG